MKIYSVKILENPSYTDSGMIEAEVNFYYNLKEALAFAEKEYQNILLNQAQMSYDYIYVNEFSVNDEDWKRFEAEIKNNKLVCNNGNCLLFEEFYLKFDKRRKEIPIL